MSEARERSYTIDVQGTGRLASYADDRAGHAIREDTVHAATNPPTRVGGRTTPPPTTCRTAWPASRMTCARRPLSTTSATGIDARLQYPLQTRTDGTDRDSYRRCSLEAPETKNPRSQGLAGSLFVQGFPKTIVLAEAVGFVSRSETRMDTGFRPIPFRRLPLLIPSTALIVARRPWTDVDHHACDSRF